MGTASLVAIITLNLVTSISFFRRKDYAMSWVWFFYAVATLGFLYQYLKDND